MSRSKRKPKFGVCCGSNTEYYRDRNRSTRTKNKNILNKLSKYKNQYLGFDNLEDLDEEFNQMEFVRNKRNKDFDSWDEPTDGSFMLDKNDPYYEKSCRK